MLIVCGYGGQLFQQLRALRTGISRADHYFIVDCLIYGLRDGTILPPTQYCRVLHIQDGVQRRAQHGHLCRCGYASRNTPGGSDQ